MYLIFMTKLLFNNTKKRNKKYQSRISATGLKIAELDDYNVVTISFLPTIWELGTHGFILISRHIRTYPYKTATYG
jgi:hypothetical protein